MTNSPRRFRCAICNFHEWVLYTDIHLRKTLWFTCINIWMLDLQLANMGIMAKTVPVFAPLTARHVTTVTAHVLVMLVGADLNVLKVYWFYKSQQNLISDMNMLFILHILWTIRSLSRKKTHLFFSFLLIFKQRCYFAACDKSYGENCQFTCSSLCFNQTCDPFNGTCLTNCKDNSHGDKCVAGTSNITLLPKCWRKLYYYLYVRNL